MSNEAIGWIIFGAFVIGFVYGYLFGRMIRPEPYLNEESKESPTVGPEKDSIWI